MGKICSICKIHKELDQYYAKNAARKLVHSQCKDCYKIKRAKFMAEHYAKYGDAYRRRARERKHTIKRHRQKQLYEHLQGKCCENCGFSDVRALDFDHINPSSKSFGIARGVNDCYSWEKIVKEIGKCKVLCANCHRIKTAKENKWRRGQQLASQSLEDDKLEARTGFAPV